MEVKFTKKNAFYSSKQNKFTVKLNDPGVGKKTTGLGS